MKLVYADNAATTKLNDKALSSMIEVMKNNFGNPSSLYSIGREAKYLVDESREKIANLLGCDMQELYFTASGSEANNQAINSAVKLGIKQGKKHIISTKIEHHSVLNTLKNLEDDFNVTYLPVNSDGLINLQDLKHEITRDTFLVTIMYVNNELGTIQNIKQIGKICQENNIIFHTDAVQAVGHFNIDFKEMNVDMLTFSGHKFNGPKGIGGLIVNKNLDLYPLIFGGQQERGKRAGTENVSSIVGMSIALEESLNNRESKNKKILVLRNYLEKKLADIGGIFTNGSLEKGVASILNIGFVGVEAETLVLFLDLKRIAISTGSACTSGSIDPSHVLMALGLNEEQAMSSIRISISEENSIDEMDYIVSSIKEFLNSV